MEFITEDMKLAVKRGAYWMDENYPRWAELIRLEDLEMDDCAVCIVGQAIGDYSNAIAKGSGEKSYSTEAAQWAVDHGFDVSEDVFEIGEGTAYKMYKALETVWTEEVRKRLG